MVIIDNEMANNRMRIAIAGSGGLAQIVAHEISKTVHPFIILSRQVQPDLETHGYQVAVVNYDDQDDLRFNLRGIDIVISTVSGNPQINLIDAAAHSRVQRFIPAEYKDKLGGRPTNDPSDRGRAASIERLRHWAHHPRHRMQYTVFGCGVFYERFAPGGLASMGISTSTALGYQGSYLMNMETNTAEIVEYNTMGQALSVSMTSVNDVARFLAAALYLDQRIWPIEFRMQGDRKTVTEIVQYAEAIKGQPFATTIIAAPELAANIQEAAYYQDSARVGRLQELSATEERRYDFSQVNLNSLVNIQPVSFWDWLRTHWVPQ
ncbi:putative isoflavone reductase family protein [Botrytis fragariae]|uniref:Putative isoflavone reductase family protein n=1 Tax=Botrytis fragariae TaxID=1964551 RepID=A0A8H6AWZ1_9HELO|nr:putative isoflavone reductase family protein [Botrytis fragariae]KAF5875097.1 putative isoflavone reductase family protein [Botrytis fragariae]